MNIKNNKNVTALVNRNSIKTISLFSIIQKYNIQAVTTLKKKRLYKKSIKAQKHNELTI